jgi:protein-disulfide isomerase
MVVVQLALVIAAFRTGADVAALREEVDAPADGEVTTSAPSEPTATNAPDSGNQAGETGNDVDSSVESIPVGFTDEGYPYRGNPDAAVTLVEYSDYGCPFCGRYTAENAPTLMEQYVAPGDVRFVFRDFPLVALHPTAPAAHTAAWCAGEQGAEMYWQMHDAIFARQTDWTGLTDPAEFLAGLAAAAGVDMTAYGACVVAGGAEAAIAEGVAEARALGFNGTPSFVFVVLESGEEHALVGAQPVATFEAYLDALLSGAEPPSSAAAAPPGNAPEAAGLPVWADRATGLQPDPDRPGVNMAGDHYRGDLEAPTVVIEFSDFECPFCRDHALGSQPIIDEALVDSGEVLWVFKHLPLDIHPGALSAAVAAECAGDQGQFWEMHDLLFATISRWAAEGVDTDAELVVLAEEMGLDRSRFSSCFDGRDALERVLSDAGDASGVISSTPSFVLVQNGRGSLLEGALPPDQFIEALRARLDEGA